jgi:malonyl-CoA O-methyltransferase
VRDIDQVFHSAKVKQGYDRWATVYDHDLNPLPALEEPYVRDAIGPPHGLDVLDLGCGTGRHSVWLARAGARVTAVDFSPEMLSRARQKVGRADVRLIEHDLQEPLPLSRHAFDVVVSGLVLEHLTDLAHFFSEIKRVLRPLGRAIVSAMHPAMFLRGSEARFVDPTSGARVAPGSIPHPLGEMIMSLQRAGLALDQIDEIAPDQSFAAKYPRAEKYVDWPMLLVMNMIAVPRVPDAVPERAP